MASPNGKRRLQVSCPEMASIHNGSRLTWIIKPPRFADMSHETNMPVHATTRVKHREKDVIRFTIRDSSLGLILVAQSAKGISAVLIGDDRDALRLDLQQRFPSATLTDSDTALDAVAVAVVSLIESPARGLDEPLDMRGSEFQCDVWRALREIPSGSTVTYTDIANRIGRPKSVRAVAQACAANSLAVVVPCHRVLRRDGQLSGYRWGVERKRELLAREATL